MASDLGFDNAFAHNRELTLEKKSRPGETIIQGFLMACGILSVLTTIGIVVILGRESLNFFTRQNWENTNAKLVSEIDAATSQFELSTSGARLAEGDILRLAQGLEEEVLLVSAVNGAIVTVERGYQDTVPITHNAGREIERANSVTLSEFVSGSRWTPQLGQFGIWPLLMSTLMTSLIAMLVALPLGLATALYLSEYASQRARNTLKPILEILAGVPTVVYGYFALTFMTPMLRNIFGSGTVNIFNTASAGIVVGILIIPLVSSMSEDALHAVPDSLRNAAYGLGATRLETAIKVVLPAALSGITAAFVVAISRAIGETMVVAIAAGAGTRNFDWAQLVQEPGATPLNPFNSAETMTGHIVRISGGDLSYNSIDYNSIFAIGLVLFVVTLTLNMISRRIVARFREVYD